MLYIFSQLDQVDPGICRDGFLQPTTGAPGPRGPRSPRGPNGPRGPQKRGEHRLGLAVGSRVGVAYHHYPPWSTESLRALAPLRQEANLALIVEH